MDLTVVDNRGQPTTYVWKVSTGRTGYSTPTGAYHPTWLDIDHVSKTYDDAKMPYAVFFTGGYAVHATASRRPPRPARLAWLRPPRPAECGPLLRPREDLRKVEHPNRDHGLSQKVSPTRQPGSRHPPSPARPVLTPPPSGSPPGGGDAFRGTSDDCHSRNICTRAPPSGHQGLRHGARTSDGLAGADHMEQATGRLREILDSDRGWRCRAGPQCREQSPGLG